MLKYFDLVLLVLSVGIYSLIAYFSDDPIFENCSAALFFFVVAFFTELPVYFFIPITLIFGFLFLEEWYVPTAQLFILSASMHIAIFALGFLWGIFDKSIDLFNYFWLKSKLRKDKQNQK